MRRVNRVRVHQGVTFRHTVVSGIDHLQHKVEMEIDPEGLGVLVHETDAEDILLPWANISAAYIPVDGAKSISIKPKVKTA